MPRVALAVILLTAATALVGCKRDKPAPPEPSPPRVTVVRPVSVPVRDCCVASLLFLMGGYSG